MKKGFTLIELSIVLIIIGLLTGGAFQMIKVMQEKARATEAKQTLEAAKEAVLGFVINHNGVLPADQVEFNTLGFRGTGNTDIHYVSDGALQICTSSTTPLNTRDQNDQNTTSVAFVLAIAGENMNVQTGRQGNTVWFHPRNININVDDETTVLNRAEPYDDFYIQVTLDELRSLADCQTNKLKIINTTLPTGTAGLPYSVTPAVIASGGKSPYTYQLINNTSTSTFTPGTNTITWATPTAGNYLLKFTVTDSIGTVSEQKDLVLTINANPTLGGTGAYDACIEGCLAGGKNATACASSCKKYQ
ncbi:MAG TPA: type II secretion system protein [Sulfuricurvum sp.]|nr:type II secretion system protein [Sulfuricurvum sp.]